MNLSNAQTNRLLDGMFRGAALPSAGAAGSAAVVNKGVWAITTVYAVGDKVVPGASMTGDGGKFLQCTTGGTSGSTTTLAVPNPGSTLTDGTVTWTAVAGIPADLAHYVALLTINKGLRASTTAYAHRRLHLLTPTGGAGGDTNQHLYRCTTSGTSAGSQPGTYLGVDGEVITDGTAAFTELSPVLEDRNRFSGRTCRSHRRILCAREGGSLFVARSGPDKSHLPGNGSTASTGTTATTSRFEYGPPFRPLRPAWGIVGAFGLYDALTAGNYQAFGVLSVPQNIGASGNTPSFAGAALTVKQDN